MSELDELLEYTGVIDLDKKVDIEEKILLIEKRIIDRQDNIKKYQKDYRNDNKERYTEYQRVYQRTYKNNNKNKEYIEYIEYINFDKVWQLLGYSRKDSAKRLLDKYFIINVDYKIQKEEPLECGGVEKLVYNNEKILITWDTFKKICIKANNKKAKEILELLI